MTGARSHQRGADSALWFEDAFGRSHRSTTRAKQFAVKAEAGTQEAKVWFIA